MDEVIEAFGIDLLKQSADLQLERLAGEMNRM